MTNPSSTPIHAGIVGGAGYAGGELIRILVHHPLVKISFIHSKSQAGREVAAVHTDLCGETGMRFSAELFTDAEGKPAPADVLFLCVGHGEARKFLEQNPIPESVHLIDLSQDFRLPDRAQSGDREFVYGLPELNRSRIQQAQHIANPGCFATAIQLALLPLAQEHLLPEVHVTGITGSTGAGQGFSETAHFSWRASNIQAYKSLTHQHLLEIGASLSALQPGFSTTPDAQTGLNFIPWRGDFTRGIFISAQMNCTLPIEELTALYERFYESHPFTHLVHQPLHLKQVLNTSKCLIQLEKSGSKLVVHAAIDNLLKGASGQAVQNMNLLFGFPETSGLQLKASYF